MVYDDGAGFRLDNTFRRRGRRVVLEQDPFGDVENEEETEVSSQMDPEFLRSEAEKLLQRAAILEQVPQEDNLPEETVLYFEKIYSGMTRYKYVTIKVLGTWHVSGAKSPSGIYWNELITFIGVGNLPSVVMLDKGVTLFNYMNAAKKALDIPHNDLDEEKASGS